MAAVMSHVNTLLQLAVSPVRLPVSCRYYWILGPGKDLDIELGVICHTDGITRREITVENRLLQSGIIRRLPSIAFIKRHVRPSVNFGTTTDPLRKRDAQVCGSQIRNLSSTLNKSMRRPPCQPSSLRCRD
ncbi:hypothetical protein Bbelb_045890 [Branchiostoma belcheri]|nr:hypothetical protein Bbelb_045890 [Branchiostoma belcheri]